MEPGGVGRTLPLPSAGLTSCYSTRAYALKSRESNLSLGFDLQPLRFSIKSVKFHARGQMIFETDTECIICFHPTRSSSSFHENPTSFFKVNPPSPRIPSSTGLTQAVGHILTSTTLQNEIYIIYLYSYNHIIVIFISVCIYGIYT